LRGRATPPSSGSGSPREAPRQQRRSPARHTRGRAEVRPAPGIGGVRWRARPASGGANGARGPLRRRRDGGDRAFLLLRPSRHRSLWRHYWGLRALCALKTAVHLGGRWAFRRAAGSGGRRPGRRRGAGSTGRTGRAPPTGGARTRKAHPARRTETPYGSRRDLRRWTPPASPPSSATSRSLRADDAPRHRDDPPRHRHDRPRHRHLRPRHRQDRTLPLHRWTRPPQNRPCPL
jgi:hypothetical protein